MGVYSRCGKFASAAALSAILLGGCAQTMVVPDEGGTATSPFPDYGDSTYPPPGGYPSSGRAHTVQAGEGLYGIARQYGLNYRDLAAWNNIPPPYTIHPGQQLVLSPPAGGYTPPPPVYTPPPYTPPPVVETPPPAPRGGATYHTVRSGETLYSISRQYGVNFRDIAGWNSIPAPYNISVGQRLVIYSSSPPPAASYTPPPVYTPPPPPSGPVVEYVDFSQGVPPPVSRAPASPTPAATGATYYAVQRGDTLYSIARRYGCSVQELAAWNGLPPPYNINVGQSLLVSQQTKSTASVKGNVYIVRMGDTLYSIARRYGRSVQELAAWNRIPQPYHVQVGQSLVVGQQAVKSTASVRARSAPPPSQPSTTTQPRAVSSPKRIYHEVKAGETLESIAKQYNQSVYQLALWNELSPPYTVYLGQKLQIILP